MVEWKWNCIGIWNVQRAVFPAEEKESLRERQRNTRRNLGRDRGGASKWLLSMQSLFFPLQIQSKKRTSTRQKILLLLLEWHSSLFLLFLKKKSAYVNNCSGLLKRPPPNLCVKLNDEIPMYYFYAHKNPSTKIKKRNIMY